MTTIIKVNTKLVAAARVFAATNDVRYYLNGVCIQPCPKPADGLLVIATNGHQLFVGKDPKGTSDNLANQPDGIILQLSNDINKACKLKKNTKLKWSGLLDQGQGQTDLITIKNYDGYDAGTFPAPVIDGKFPDWQTIIPSAEPEARASVNPEYLGCVATAAKLLGCKSCNIVCRGTTTSSSFNLTECQDDLSAYTVLMPLRVDNDSDKPEWI